MNEMKSTVSEECKACREGKKLWSKVVKMVENVSYKRTPTYRTRFQFEKKVNLGNTFSRSPAQTHSLIGGAICAVYCRFSRAVSRIIPDCWNGKDTYH